LPLILIVDDDRDLNAAIQDALSEEGYSCIAALDGDDGFCGLVEHEPDLVLLDFNLSGMTCPEFLENKAEVTSVAEIPVIVMTGLSCVPKLDRVVAVLEKPFDVDELLALVRKLAPARLEASVAQASD
jgi:two-component system, OmpR family, response regulator MprA